jgi:predicted kinase
LANALAGHLGIPHISSDVVRKQMIGVRPTTHRMEAFLTGMYTPAMTRRTYAIMRRHAARYLRRGMSVVLDATYGQPAERAALRRLARRVGADALFIICRADEDVLKQRLTARRADPHTTSDARIDIWPALRAAFVEPAELPTALYAEMSQPLEEVLERVLARAYTPGSAAVGRTLLEDRARTSSTSAPCAGVSQPAANCYGARH